LDKISYIFSSRRITASGKIDKHRRIIEVARPFEPTVQLWLNGLNYSAGITKEPDAVTRIFFIGVWLQKFGIRDTVINIKLRGNLWKCPFF
jgi:hypothetical protein